MATTDFYSLISVRATAVCHKLEHSLTAPIAVLNRLAEIEDEIFPSRFFYYISLEI